MVTTAPDGPSETETGATSTRSSPTVTETAPDDPVGLRDHGGQPREVDARDVMGRYVGMPAGRSESDPRHAAAGEHDARQAGGEDDSGVGPQSPGERAGGQQDGAHEDRRQHQVPALRQAERGSEPREQEPTTGRGDRRTVVGAVQA